MKFRSLVSVDGTSATLEHSERLPTVAPAELGSPKTFKWLESVDDSM